MSKSTVRLSVADPHNFYADPNPTFHFNSGRDLAPHKKTATEVPGRQALRGSILNFHASICECPGLSPAPYIYKYIKKIKIPNFDFYVEAVLFGY